MIIYGNLCSKEKGNTIEHELSSAFTHNSNAYRVTDPYMQRTADKYIRRDRNQANP